MAINYLNSITLNQNELLQARVENQPNDAAAGSGVSGQIYFNTTDNQLRVFDGTAWGTVDADEYRLDITAGPTNGTSLYLNKNGSAVDLIRIMGTDNEIQVTEITTGTRGIFVGLPDDVTVSNDLTVNNDVLISGNLQVTGTTTTINTETVTIADNIITLNSNATGSATEDAGIEVERGADANVDLIWDESLSRWRFTNDGVVYQNIPIPSEYDVFQISLRAGGNEEQVVSGDSLTFIAGGGLNVTSSGPDDHEVTYSHADTSSQASVDNSGLNVIQDVTLDTYGHVSGLASIDITQGVNYLIDTKVNATGYSATITDTATITHGLNTRDVIIQLYDATTYETVYADVDRISTTQTTITFASTPTNSIRVLVQKIS